MLSRDGLYSHIRVRLSDYLLCMQFIRYPPREQRQFMLGNWSYSVYLWHVPVYLAVMVGFAASRHPVSQLNPPSARLLLLATALQS